MSNNAVMKYAMKPILCGVVAKVAASALIGVDGSGSLQLFGMDWAPSTVIGISVAGATIAAAFTIAAVRFTVGPLGDLRSIFELAAIGAGSEVGGTYLHDVLVPMMASPHTVQAMR